MSLLSLLCSLLCLNLPYSSTNKKQWKTLQNTVKASNILKHKIVDPPKSTVESGDTENGEDSFLSVDGNSPKGPSCQFFPHKASLTSQHMLPLPSLKE